MARTLRIKLPSIKDVEFTIECLPEEQPIKGNAISTGDEDEDQRVENAIFQQLDNGNEWAWCCVKVTASYRGLTAEDYLGCCSYADKKDFEKDMYFKDMKQTTYKELIKQIENLK